MADQVFNDTLEYDSIAIRAMKKDLYEQLARLGKAAASPVRLELIDLLCQGPRTVEALAQEAALTVADASQHLRILHAARLVDSEKTGLYVTYRLADGAVEEFFQGLGSVGEKRRSRFHSAAVQRVA